MVPDTRCLPNQVWMWDIIYLRGPIKGQFYYLYLISDLYLMQNNSLRHLSTVRIISPKGLKISMLPENGVSCSSNGIATSITTVALNSSRRRRCIMAKQKLSWRNVMSSTRLLRLFIRSAGTTATPVTGHFLKMLLLIQSGIPSSRHKNIKNTDNYVDNQR